MTEYIEETPVIPFSFDKYYYELINIVKATQNQSWLLNNQTLNIISNVITM